MQELDNSARHADERSGLNNGEKASEEREDRINNLNPGLTPVHFPGPTRSQSVL